MQQEYRGPDWIQTYTGLAFWPLDPRPKEIRIVDIARSLSKTPRYRGHTRGFYSVAEHSVLLSRAVPLELARWALLHDAAEAYTVDAPAPIKARLGDLPAIELRIMECVAERFDLPWPVPPELKAYDRRILHNESRALLGPHPFPWDIPGDPLPGVTVEALDHREAFDRFFSRFIGLWPNFPPAEY